MERFGPSWAVLSPLEDGSSCPGQFSASWEAVLVVCGAAWNWFGGALEAFWAVLGCLGPFWAFLGPLGAVLGTKTEGGARVLWLFCGGHVGFHFEGFGMPFLDDVKII